MRILVVEDEQKIAHLIKRGLTLEAFAVDVCDTGDEALRLIDENTYQVLILDRRLPGSMEGTELCKELRNRNNVTPILLLTARGKTQDKIDGLNCGADDYMTKPFDFNELVARVRALSRRALEVRPVVLTYDELMLDMTRKTVTRSGKHLTLTAKELSLLEYFMQHPGQILSKEAIIARIWDYDAVIIANNVEVHIKALRRKIDRPFSYPLIHTVKGLGYKLEHL
ncbi:MAG TPA: response regulator transcription factor [Candidatus Saccharimonadales bacterium]|nr:response regulator transcription factor [Candidatus Saccharimonadales bacterium]